MSLFFFFSASPHSQSFQRKTWRAALERALFFPLPVAGATRTVAWRARLKGEPLPLEGRAMTTMASTTVTLDRRRPRRLHLLHLQLLSATPPGGAPGASRALSGSTTSASGGRSPSRGLPRSSTEAPRGSLPRREFFISKRKEEDRGRAAAFFEGIALPMGRGGGNSLFPSKIQ